MYNVPMQSPKLKKAKSHSWICRGAYLYFSNNTRHCSRKTFSSQSETKSPRWSNSLRPSYSCSSCSAFKKAASVDMPKSLIQRRLCRSQSHHVNARLTSGNPVSTLCGVEMEAPPLTPLSLPS